MSDFGKLVLTADSLRESFMELFHYEEGTVFKVEGDFETVMRRIEDYKPTEGEFEVFPVTPGMDSYSLLGPDYCMVVKNTLVWK